VRFIAGSQSGTATITAFSGGSSGKLENLRVGTAAAERVVLSASPQTLGPSGGNSEISARVEDISGAGVPGVPVTFTADVGSLSASTANTDQSGVAKTTLTTSRQAVVTANVAGKTATVTVALNPRTGIAITAPTTAIPAGTPASFSVTVGSTANIRSVTVNWGDGSAPLTLGAISGSTNIQHIFQEDGSFIVTATATDTSGFTESVSASVTILPAQPPSVILTVSNTTPIVNEPVVIRATVSGNTSSIIRYDWNFGANASQPPISTTGGQVSVFWTAPGPKTIVVTVFQAQGPSADGFASVTVSLTLSADSKPK
jgi:hypothetical protein